MLKPHQIFTNLADTVGPEIVRYFRDEEREVYKSTVASLAIQRKLRPVFVQKKPLDKQIAWIVDTLKLKSSDTVGEQLLQVWLMKGQQELLVTFLDHMKIDHDGEGSVEDLPEELDDAQLGAAIDKLLEKHAPENVAIYLHMFKSQRPNGYENLDTILAEDERLQIGEA